MIGMATEGFALTNMSWTERIIAFIGAMLLITASPIQDAIGFGILVLISLIQLRKRKQAI